jgi:hypothetical protein
MHENTPNEKYIFFLGIKRTISSADSLKVEDGAQNRDHQALLPESNSYMRAGAIKESGRAESSFGRNKKPFCAFNFNNLNESERKTTNDTENIISSANKSNSICYTHFRPTPGHTKDS